MRARGDVRDDHQAAGWGSRRALFIALLADFDWESRQRSRVSVRVVVIQCLGFVVAPAVLLGELDIDGLPGERSRSGRRLGLA